MVSTQAHRHFNTLIRKRFSPLQHEYVLFIELLYDLISTYVILYSKAKSRENL